MRPVTWLVELRKILDSPKDEYLIRLRQVVYRCQCGTVRSVNWVDVHVQHRDFVLLGEYAALESALLPTAPLCQCTEGKATE